MYSLCVMAEWFLIGNHESWNLSSLLSICLESRFSQIVLLSEILGPWVLASWQVLDFSINHRYYNFLESDWSISPPIRALIGHLHVIGHLQSEIVILMINW